VSWVIFEKIHVHLRGGFPSRSNSHRGIEVQGQREKATLKAWPSHFQVYERRLYGFFRPPITQVQVFPDFSSFVTVFHGFLGSVVRLAERMFGIANGFTDDFERFCHGSNYFLSFA